MGRGWGGVPVSMRVFTQSREVPGTAPFSYESQMHWLYCIFSATVFPVI